MAKRVWSAEEWWYSLLTDNNPPLPGRQLRHRMRMLLGAPRCKFCNAPQQGVFGRVMQAIRLSSAAAAGEILITHEAATEGPDREHLERRELELKGKRQTVEVYVWKQLG